MRTWHIRVTDGGRAAAIVSANIFLAAVALLSIQVPVQADTGVPPACSGGAFTDECLDFEDSARESLVRHRLDRDRDTGTGAKVARDPRLRSSRYCG